MPRDIEGYEALPPHLDPRRPIGPARTKSSGRPHRFGHRFVVFIRTIAAVLSLVLLIGAGVATSFSNQLTGTGQNVDGISGNVDGAGVNGADENILIVGDDSRTGYTKAQLAEMSTQDDGGTNNTDTIMLVHVPADGSRASVVSLPRDTYVSIPGYKKAKINSAYADGYNDAAGSGATTQERVNAGQDLLIQTVSQLTGLKIDHYVTVTLLGFLNLTQALGGIEVNLCKPAKDAYSGINLPAGPQLLNPQQALQFVRQRHGLPNGDLDRIKRQQYFFGAVIRKALHQNLLNVANLEKFITALKTTVTYDKALNPLDLAEQMHDIAAGDVQFRTLPLAAEPNQSIDGQDVIMPASNSVIRQFFQTLNGGSAPATTNAPAAASTVPANEITVDVLNGTGKSGLGGDTSTALSNLGFVAGNVLTTGTTTTTTIKYPASLKAQATTLQAQVPEATLTVDPSLSGHLQLVLGANFTSLSASQATSSAPAAAATTSAPNQTAATTGCIN